MRKYIDYQGNRYFYEHRLAKDGEICLATMNPDEHCNGVYAYSRKDPGDGMAFVVTETSSLKTRESGYFWVITHSLHGWTPAGYDATGGCWSIIGHDMPLTDGDFLEIDERRIVRNEPGSLEKALSLAIKSCDELRQAIEDKGATPGVVSWMD